MSGSAGSGPIPHTKEDVAVIKNLSLSVLAVLLVSLAPAAALDTVDDALCICADGALGTGDYVSCLSKMTRRLVAAGVITQTERSDLVSDASSTDLEALQDYCDSLGGGGGLEGFGTSYHVRDAFCPAWSPSGPLCGVIGKLRMWNFTDDDIYLVSRQGGSAEGCLFVVTVYTANGLVARRTPSACFDALTEYPLPIGTVWEYDLVVPMMAENSDPAAGLIDSEGLPNGIYEIRIEWILSGPEKVSGTFNVEGDYPEIVLPVRVGGSAAP
jgi:hypothetical protein